MPGIIRERRRSRDGDVDVLDETNEALPGLDTGRTEKRVLMIGWARPPSCSAVRRFHLPVFIFHLRILLPQLPHGAGPDP